MGLAAALALALLSVGAFLCSGDRAPAHCTRGAPCGYLLVGAGLLGGLVAALLFLVHDRTLRQVVDTHRIIALRVQKKLLGPAAPTSSPEATHSKDAPAK
jgi:hypothetical protein